MQKSLQVKAFIEVPVKRGYRQYAREQITARETPLRALFSHKTVILSGAPHR
jgi:hypothetical protein